MSDQSRAFGVLPVSAYRVGDLVFGDDGEGGTSDGQVMRVNRDKDEVTVRWNGEKYDPGTIGNVCSPAWLRLWPASKQVARLAEAGLTEAGRPSCQAPSNSTRST